MAVSVNKSGIFEPQVPAGIHGFYGYSDQPRLGDWMRFAFLAGEISQGFEALLISWNVKGRKDLGRRNRFKSRFNCQSVKGQKMVKCSANVAL